MIRSCVCLLAIVAVTSGSASRAEELEKRLGAIGQRLPEFKQRTDKLRAAGQDVSYPLVSYTVLENFIPFMRDDLSISVPSAWGWVTVGPNVSGYEPVHESHSGKWAVRIHNNTPRAPNVYGMMENS